MGPERKTGRGDAVRREKSAAAIVFRTDEAWIDEPARRVTRCPGGARRS